MCDDDVWKLVRFRVEPKFAPSGARTRRKELVRLGLVRDSGVRKRTEANRPTIVWEAV